ncbi:MAG: 50S ribosomal protein L19, partial [Sulfurihydrogenibium azorense]
AKLYYIRNLKGKSARIRELKEWEIKKRSQESQAAKENNG